VEDGFSESDEYSVGDIYFEGAYYTLY
jgi:hypothetical protein